MATTKSAERPFTIHKSYLPNRPPELFLHISITVQDTADESRRWTGCGDSWCRGQCGQPLLRVHWPEQPELHMRVFGPQVAFGPVVQQVRRPWEGEQVLLPEDVSTYLRGCTWV